MKVKLTCGLIVIIFILNAVFISWNNEFKADTPESNSQNTSRNTPLPLSNGGIEWSQIEVISEPVAGQNFNTGGAGWPAIAVEGDKIYVVWQGSNDTNNAGTDSDIFYRYFDGKVWGDMQVISEPVPGKDLNTMYSMLPAIAVENGRIYVVWQDANDTNGAGWDEDIFFRCNLTGSNWEDIQVISEPVPGQGFNGVDSKYPKIAVENGSIYVVWTDENNTNGCGGGGLDPEIFYKCNITGTSWEPVQVISEPVYGQNINKGDSYSPNIAVEDGKIYVTWTDNNNTNGAGPDYDTFYICNLTGYGWEDVQVISEPVPGNNFNTGGSSWQAIEVENGIIYVVWDDDNNTNGAGVDNDIIYRCNLTGSSWEPMQVISEPVPGQNFNNRDSFVPNIVVKDRRIFVIWNDWNNTNNAGIDNDVFYRSNLTGINWEPVEVISEPVYGQNFNTHGNMIQRSSIALNDKLHVVWNDGNNTDGSGTDGDICYRWKPFSSLFFKLPKVAPKAGNTSTEFNFTVIYNQLNNTPPTRMKVIIDGIEHTMIEYDPMDTNYTDGKKYYFKVKNLDIGPHTYEFNASDGVNYTNSRLFTYYPYVTNTLPQIITEDNLTAIEDQYYEINYEFEDMDIANVGQVCHWEFATNASWLDFNLITGKLSGTPGNDDVGECWVYIAVNDTIDITLTNFTLTVLDVNDDPIIETANLKSTNEDELYEVDYNATDIDSSIGNQLWTLDTNATAWLDISSSNGILNGTPGNDEVGKYWINITVNDTEGGFDFTNFTLTVLNMNDDPEIITEDLHLAETDKLYEVQYNATDIDSSRSKFSWSLETNATWLTIDPNIGVLSGTPTRTDAGLFVVNVTISDGDGGIDWHEFILTVYKGNLPPIITTEDVETARVKKSYEVDYNATDDRTPADQLAWTLETNASWLSIDPTIGILSGTPTSKEGGKQYWVNVSVRDIEHTWGYQNFTLTVLKEPKIVIKNNIPRLLNLKLVPAEGDTNTEFLFSVLYSDADNETPETIQVVIDGNMYDMELRSGEIAYNGLYEYKTKLSKGEHSYYFIASDGTDTNTSVTFTTPDIQKPLIGDGKETKKEGIAWEWLILVIVVIIVILIILFLLIRRKKKEEEEIIPSTQPEISEPIVETDQAQVSVVPEEPTPYPEYETGESMVQEDFYTAPPEEQTTAPTTPDYTTPEKQEQEYESFKQPEQAQEEEGVDKEE